MAHLCDRKLKIWGEEICIFVANDDGLYFWRKHGNKAFKIIHWEQNHPGLLAAGKLIAEEWWSKRHSADTYESGSIL